MLTWIQEILLFLHDEEIDKFLLLTLFSIVFYAIINSDK